MTNLLHEGFTEVIVERRIDECLTYVLMSTADNCSVLGATNDYIYLFN